MTKKTLARELLIATGLAVVAVILPLTPTIGLDATWQTFLWVFLGLLWLRVIWWAGETLWLESM